MITHKEAEILTSARQDAPLDPIVERELQAHLATCDECRAFAIATERLTAGIKAMPSIPASPRTRREVMERVERGRNPLAGLFGGLGGFQSGPVFAAAAALVIIGLFGWWALDNRVFDDGGSSDIQVAAVPTEEPVDLLVASPTQAPPTETPAPTETAVPRATDVPEPTATEEPEPTATIPPDPTATDVPQPTATSPPEPTATTAPSEAPVEAAVGEEEGEPTDLTTLSEPAGADEPTATTAPTEEPTTVPTEEPTVAPTPEPTEEPTVEPTAEPEPTNTPAIEPMDGSTFDDAATGTEAKQTQIPDGSGSAGSTEVPTGRGQGPDSDLDGAPIEPTGDQGEAAGESVNTTAIEPMGGDDTGDAGIGEEEGSTPETDASGDSSEQSAPEYFLAEASVPYSGIAGDPSGKLGLTREGRLEFMQVPDGASRTTLDGLRLESAESQPGVIQLCGDGFCEPAVASPESQAWQGDVPLGVIGDTTYFMRLYSDRTEIYAGTSSGTQVIDPQVISEVGPTSAPTAVYENDRIMFAWLPSGEWLEISNGNAQVFPGSYADPTNVRFAPMAADGPLIGYFSNGTLVIASVTAPDVPVFSIQSDGIDFDLTGIGERVAVIEGNDIVIYDLQGNRLEVYSGGDMQPGSVIWLNSGIVYVDRNTGALFQIPDTAP